MVIIIEVMRYELDKYNKTCVINDNFIGFGSSSFNNPIISIKYLTTYNKDKKNMYNSIFSIMFFNLN